MLIASTGAAPRAGTPTIFLGARGAMNFDLVVDLREGGHHSGNWGGLLANPGVILAHALASIASAKGAIKIPEWKPSHMPNSVRMALADCTVEGGEDAPEIDPDWGEPGLSPSEKVFGWCSFEVLAFTTGNPENPVNAIPPKATATCQIRFVVGVDPEESPALRRHLDAQGFPMVRIEPGKKACIFPLPGSTPTTTGYANRRPSIQQTTGKRPAILPNLGGSLPNDIFAGRSGPPDDLGPAFLRLPAR